MSDIEDEIELYDSDDSNSDSDDNLSEDEEFEPDFENENKIDDDISVADIDEPIDQIGGNKMEIELNDEAFEIFDKFSNFNKDAYIKTYHPECIPVPCEEIHSRSIITSRNEKGIINCPYHRTSPHMSKYERTRCIALLANYLASGLQLSIPLTNNNEQEMARQLIDNRGYINDKGEKISIPFIIRRRVNGKDENGNPIPFEYWNISDLEPLNSI